MRTALRGAVAGAALSWTTVVLLAVFFPHMAHTRVRLVFDVSLTLAIVTSAAAVVLRCVPPVISAYGIGYRDGLRDCREQHDDGPTRRLRAVSSSQE